MAVAEKEETLTERRGRRKKRRRETQRRERCPKKIRRAKPATGQRHRPRCRQRRRQSVASRHHPAPSFNPHRACKTTNRWWSGVVKVCSACSGIMRTAHMSRSTCSLQRRETRTRILPWGGGTHSRKDTSVCWAGVWPGACGVGHTARKVTPLLKRWGNGQRGFVHVLGRG